MRTKLQTMSALEEIAGIEAAIRQMVEVERKSHEKVSVELMVRFARKKGLSSRSVRRFTAVSFYGQGKRNTTG